MKIRYGLSIFAALSVVGLIGVFFIGAEPAPLFDILERIDLPFLLLCVFAVPVFDWFTAGFRLYLFTRVLTPGIRYLACVKICAVGVFMAAATPAQMGAGVAQTYALVKEGATITRAFMALLMTFLATLTFYVITISGLAVATLSGALEYSGSPAPIVAAASVFLLLATVLGFAAARPEPARRILQTITGRLGRWRRLARVADRVQHGIADAAEAMQEITRHHKRRFALGVALSFFVFGNKYFAAYLAARAIGVDPPLVELMVAQAVLHVALYFFPTPGASGGAEIGAAIANRAFVPADLLAPHTLLWRIAILYFSVLVGGLFLLGYVRRKAPERVDESG
jgi:uncharacterized protein (TIRG00374 family)